VLVGLRVRLHPGQQPLPRLVLVEVDVDDRVGVLLDHGA
jgi:hypothetical protein